MAPREADVIKYGLDQSQYLIEVQEKDLYDKVKKDTVLKFFILFLCRNAQNKFIYLTQKPSVIVTVGEKCHKSRAIVCFLPKGLTLEKSNPAHYVSVFNKQTKRSKDLAKFAYATLHASSLLSKQ